MGIALTGRKVLVTGGSRGIGRGIVLAAAAAGADVITCYRQEGEAVESLVKALAETGGDHHVLRADVGEIAEIDRLVGEAKDRFGRLDGVVNNAGVISHVPFGELPAEEWSRVLNSHVTAAYRVIQQSLPLFGEGASVVNIGARGAAAGIPLRAHYTAAKAAMIGLSRSLAVELGPRGIRVNVVAPGIIETEAFAAMPQERADGMRQMYSKKTALGRLGTVPELAGPVLFLLSDLSSYLTGETLNVDGGI
ncbi:MULTISPECIES: SDR family NAD(P)-dependent oxidoreductase [unclassified Streptomyces]|uniref:SDR family NAD(P)-dependent oxidoreductase n=1 Tax=unclassified Streptomyces TaxID=2593676 RepID=UPI002033EE71|nr:MULTISPECIES: SDR family oxidoreductase [unclassified Streptomyces]MCM2423207.1 SDR family oxidoreductase [Streptomyces sp. RKAG293]MCM2424581.1 SDR family oxidoreductase [Streptomyces sp. RKAG337]